MLKYIKVYNPALLVISCHFSPDLLPLVRIKQVCQVFPKAKATLNKNVHIFSHHLQVHQFGLRCQLLAVGTGTKCTNQKALKQVKLQSRRI